MIALRTAWVWIRDHAVMLVVTSIAVLGAGWLWDYRRKQAQLRDAQDQLTVQRARNVIAASEARRSMLLERVDDRSAEIKALSDRIEASKRKIDAIQKRGPRTPEEIDAGFTRLGL